jgi:hypothetical protein
MKNFIKKKKMTISFVAIFMLTIVGSISTTMSYNNSNSNTIEPVAEKEVVNIQVSKDQIKQPLAITDDELETETLENESEKIYDESLIEIISDPSIEVNEGVLLENGGEYIEKAE